MPNHEITASLLDDAPPTAPGDDAAAADEPAGQLGSWAIDSEGGPSAIDDFAQTRRQGSRKLIPQGYQKPCAVVSAIICMSTLMLLMPGALLPSRACFFTSPTIRRASTRHAGLTPSSPCACTTRAGADLDNEGGKDDWGGDIISRCGNGHRDFESETCDDGNLQDGDGCDRHCHLEIPHGCGNVFDKVSWQRWANVSQPGLLGSDRRTPWQGKRPENKGAVSALAFHGVSGAAEGKLTDWRHPQAVTMTGGGTVSCSAPAPAPPKEPEAAVATAASSASAAPVGLRRQQRQAGGVTPQDEQLLEQPQREPLQNL